jgi:hypothetical protein
MATGTTIANALMRQDIAPRLYKSFPQEFVLWNIIQDAPSAQLNARGLDMSAVTGDNPSAGWRAEGDYLPVPGSAEYARMNVKITRFYSEEEVTGDLVDMQDVQAIGNLLKTTVQRGTDAFKRKLNQACYGDTTGAIGIVTARTTGAGGSFTCSPSTTPTGSRYIPKGARVQFFTTGLVAHATGAAVTTVTANNTTTGVCTCDNVPTDAAVNDIVVFEGSAGLAMNGLNGLIQNANITFQGVSTSTYPTLKATVYDAAGAALTLDMLDTTILRTKLAGGVGAPVDDFVIIANPKQVQAYRKLGYALTSVTVDSDRAKGKLDLGFPLVSYNGMRFREDLDCGDSDIYGLRLSSLMRFKLRDPGLYEDKDGDMLHQKYGTGVLADAFYIAWVFKGNLGTPMPSANFRVANLSVSGLG